MARASLSSWESRHFPGRGGVPVCPSRRRVVAPMRCASLRLNPQRWSASGRRLSPPPRAVPTIRGRMLRRDVDGAIRHPTGRRPASWKERRWLEIREARCVGCRTVSPAMVPLPARMAPVCQPRPKERSSRSSGQLAAVPKIAETRAEKAIAMGRATAPLNGCRSRHCVPVVPSPALPAGLVAFAFCERRLSVHSEWKALSSEGQS
jgi:hypothetical protein